MYVQNSSYIKIIQNTTNNLLFHKKTSASGIIFVEFEIKIQSIGIHLLEQ